MLISSGSVSTFNIGPRVKFAVITLLADIINGSGLFVPAASPPQPRKLCPASGIAVSVTLALNGFRLEASVQEAADVILAMATGDMGVAGLEAWLRPRAFPDNTFSATE